MSIIKRLPSWALVTKYPAFYDVESLTVNEQTARLYAKMQELIESYNKYVEQINAELVELEQQHDKDYNCFIKTILKLTEDYISTVDIKLVHQDREIAEHYEKLVTNLSTTLRDLIKELQETGELDELILQAFDNLDERMTTLESDVEAFKVSVNEDISVLSLRQTSVESIIEHQTNVIEEQKTYVDNKFNDLQNTTLFGLQTGVSMNAQAINELQTGVSANTQLIDDLDKSTTENIGMTNTYISEDRAAIAKLKDQQPRHAIRYKKSWARVYVDCNAETDGDGSKDHPFNNLDSFFIRCNQGHPDNRCYLVSAGVYNTTFRLFNHVAFHITGKVAGCTIRFLNVENDDVDSGADSEAEGTVTFYGGHYNFNNVNLEWDDDKSLYFETCSIAFFRNCTLTGKLFKTYGCFITTNSNTKLTVPKCEFHGTNGRIDNLECTLKTSTPIKVHRGCNIGFYGTLTMEGTDTSKTDGTVMMDIQDSVVYIHLDAVDGGKRNAAMNAFASVIYMNQAKYDLFAAQSKSVYVANGCIFLNNSSATTYKNMFTAGSYDV